MNIYIAKPISFGLLEHGKGQERISSVKSYSLLSLPYVLQFLIYIYMDIYISASVLKVITLCISS